MRDTPQDYSGNPHVSVVVPVYNVERYLRQCLNSLIHQTLKNIEIIIVNDGSTDNCPVICDEYAERDKRVKVIHQQNGGYGKACNVGFNAARGEYIGIIEADDFAALDMFMRLYNAAKAHNLDIARSQHYFYRTRENTYKRYNQTHIPPNIIFSPLENHSVFYLRVAVWSQIYRSQFIRENSIRFLETSGASYQDTSFSFKAHACANRFMLIEDSLVYYRYDNEKSSIRSKEKPYCICDEFAEIERFAKEKGLYDDLKYLIAKMKFKKYNWNYNRLEKELAAVFLRTFVSEMRQSNAKKEIKRELFEKGEYKAYNAVISRFSWFHIRQRLR